MAKRRGSTHTITGYIKGDGTRVDVTDWHGKKIGEGVRRSCWKTPRSHVSSTMCQYDVEIDGKMYTGRSAGNQMSWAGRPSISASTRARRGSRR
jgi:hypothetical protein